jgi:hypothetical protein
VHFKESDTHTHSYAIPSAHIQMDGCTSGNSIHTEFSCGLLVLNVFKSSTITYMQQTARHSTKSPQLFDWYQILPKNLTIWLHKWQKISLLYGIKYSSLCSQQPTIGPYYETIQFTAHLLSLRKYKAVLMHAMKL